MEGGRGNFVNLSKNERRSLKENRGLDDVVKKPKQYYFLRVVLKKVKKAQMRQYFGFVVFFVVCFFKNLKGLGGGIYVHIFLETILMGYRTNLLLITLQNWVVQ